MEFVLIQTPLKKILSLRSYLFYFFINNFIIFMILQIMIHTRNQFVT